MFFLPPKTMMNGARYIEVLRDHLLPFMPRHNCTHFLQDGAAAARPVGTHETDTMALPERAAALHLFRKKTPVALAAMLL